MSFTQTAVGGSIVVALGTLAIQAVNVPKPPERHLDVGPLEFFVIDDVRHVRQQVTGSGGQILPAEWSASIQRAVNGTTELLCMGSGAGNYNGEISTWDLPTWTDDDCPEDAGEVDDVFEVSWTYENTSGYLVTIGGRFVLTPEGLVPEKEVTE